MSSTKRYQTIVWFNELNRIDSIKNYEIKLQRFQQQYPQLAECIVEEDVVDFIMCVDDIHKKPLSPGERVALRERVVHFVRVYKYDDQVLDLLVMCLGEWGALP